MPNNPNNPNARPEQNPNRQDKPGSDKDPSKQSGSCGC